MLREPADQFPKSRESGSRPVNDHERVSRYRSDRATLTSAVTARISTATNRTHATRMAHQKRVSEDWKQFVDCYWTIVFGVLRFVA